MKLKQLNPNKKMAIMSPDPMHPGRLYLRTEEDGEGIWYYADWKKCSPEEVASHRDDNGDIIVGLELAWLRGTR
jgi:hypothetical protein